MRAPLLIMAATTLLAGCTAPSVSPPSPQSPATTASSPAPSATPSGSDSPTPSPSGTESGSPSPSSSGLTSGSPSPSASETGSAGAFRAAGEVLDLNGEITITVMESKRQKVAGHPGNQILVMAKSCNVNAAAGINLTWDTWVLLGPDSEEYPASKVKGSAEPAPVYPNDAARLYKPGQCAKGWIVFDVPTNSSLSGVRYMNANGDSAQWRLSAAI